MLGVGAGLLQLALQDVVEEAAKLLGVLLNVDFLPGPAERLHQLLGRHWLLLVVQLVEQHLQGGWELALVHNLRLKHQVPA